MSIIIVVSVLSVVVLCEYFECGECQRYVFRIMNVCEIYECTIFCV